MKKKLLIGLAILGGILILGAAAFLGARLLAPAQAANSTSGGPGDSGRVLSIGGGPGGGGGGKTFELKTIPAEEIPQRSPDMHGAITEIKDNSFMVTSVKNVTVMKEKGGDTQTDYEYDGPAVEVVVTQETQIYNDTTFDDIDMLSQAEGGSKELQQTLESVDFSELGPQTMLTVWGYKRGDRLVAEVIVAETP